MARKVFWGTALAAWVLFTFWYTNTRGALTADEIDDFIGRYAETAAEFADEADLARLRAFLESDTGRQFIMVNLLDLAAAARSAFLGGPEASAANAAPGGGRPSIAFSI